MNIVELDEVLDRGIIAHIEIKMKLKRIILGEQNELPENVSADNLCLIGQWIYGPGQEFVEMMEFQDLVRIHKNFHKEAYNALMLNKNGKNNEALEYIKTGPFQQKSREMQTILTKIKYKVKALKK